MKKVLFFIAMTLYASFSHAQWNKTDFPADELKGNSAYTAYMFKQADMGSFVFWSNKEFQFRINSDDGIFNYETGYNKYSGSYRGASVMVGLYDEENNLIDKFTMWLDCDNDRPTELHTRDAGYMSTPIGQKGKVKKIMQHIASGSGYVRIVTPRYGKLDFDLKVTPLTITK